MRIVKYITTALLLLCVSAIAFAQCGNITLVNPQVNGNNVTFQVWYNSPPSTINNLNLYINLGTAIHVNSIGYSGFTAVYDNVYGAPRIYRTTSYNTMGNNFKLADITFSLPLNQSTNICLNAGLVTHPGGNCLPSNLGSPCLFFTMPSVTINGSVVRAPLGNPMNNVQVIIQPITGNPVSVQTYSQGTYSAVMAPSTSFSATASRDDASSQCGITEYDIAATQRAINYYTYNWLPTPEERIAADANRNGIISTSDIIEIRKVILGIGTGFIKDWELVPYAAYVSMGMPSDPLQVPSYSTQMSVNPSDPINNTFLGIKYGDVDKSGSSCAQTTFAETVASKMIRIGKAQLQADKTVLIPVYGKEFQSEMLFSLGLQFDPASVQIIGLKAGVLPEFNEDCYAIDANQSGLVNILWINTKSKTGVSVKSTEPLFYVQAKLLFTDTKISEKIVSLSYDRLQNISINSGENFRKGETLGLEYEEAEGGANILSLPNEHSSKLKTGLHPNPFKNQLNLNFDSPIGGQAELRLLNQNGQLLHHRKLEVVSGKNNISLGQLDVIPSGVVLYQLVLPGTVLSGKLIKE